MFQESPRWKHSGLRLELTWGLHCGAGGSWGSMQGPQDANRYTWSVQSFFRRCKTQKTKGHWNHRKKFEYLKKEKTFLYMEALKQQLLSLEYWETSFSGIASRLIKHALKTYASLTILPYLSTIVSYKLLITDALCLGNSSQENCVPRSSLIGMACRVLYLWLFVKMDVWQSSVLFHCHQKEGFYFTGCCLVKQK